MSCIDIRGSGGCWIITDAQGRQIGRPTNSFDKACIRANVEERRRQRIKRSCMCCGTDFTAEGRFHRLCDTCSASASEGLFV